MLDRTSTQEAPVSVHRWRMSDFLVAVAFFGTAGAAMLAWIAAIAWASWLFIEWVLF